MAKKQKIKSGTAVWINEVGSIKLRVFNVIKENKEKESILISFKINEAYWIKKNNIRAKRAIIYQKKDGKIICQNPDNIGRIDLDALGIKTLRFNLQNSSLQESRSAIYRWTTPKDAIDRLSPIFKLMFICIAVGVMAWAALKFGGVALDAIMRSRLMECSELMVKSPSPIATVINSTIPVGA